MCQSVKILDAKELCRERSMIDDAFLLRQVGCEPTFAQLRPDEARKLSRIRPLLLLLVLPHASLCPVSVGVTAHNERKAVITAIADDCCELCGNGTS